MTDAKVLSESQILMIKEHLNLVFEKQTSSLVDLESMFQDPTKMDICASSPFQPKKGGVYDTVLSSSIMPRSC